MTAGRTLTPDASLGLRWRVLIATASSVFTHASAAPCPPQALNTFNVPELPDIRASTVWDPDDQGPQRPILAISGFFDLSFPFRARGIIGWDGTRLVPIEVASSQSFKSMIAHRGTLYGVSEALYRYEPATKSWVVASPDRFSVRGAVVFRDELVIVGSGATSSVSASVFRNGDWIDLPGVAANSVDSVTVVNDQLVLAGSLAIRFGPGSFESVRAAAYDGDTWKRFGSALSDSGTPAAIASSGDATLLSLGTSLYSLENDTWVRHTDAARAVFAADGRAFARPANTDDGRLIVFDGHAWTRLGDLRRAILLNGVSFTLNSMAWFQGRLHALGSSTGEVAASSMLEYVGTEWRPFGEGPGGTISVMLPTDGLVYTTDGMRGRWSASISQRPHRPFVRAWDGTRFRAVGAAFEAPPSSIPGSHQPRIASLSHDEQFGVVATGFFSGNSGVPMTGVAFLSGDDWLPLGSQLDMYREANGTLRDPLVNRVLRYRGDLLALGRFSLDGSHKNENIARLVGGVWTTLTPPLAPPFQAASYTDAVAFGSKLFVTGDGLVSPTSTSNTTAIFDGVSWSTPSDEIDGSAGFCVQESTLFAARDWYPASSRVLRWTEAGWVALSPAPGLSALTLAEHAGSLFAAGLGPVQRWTGSSWAPAPGASIGEVFALVSDRSELLLGGRFSDFGQPRDFFLRYTLDRVPSFATQPRSRSFACGSTVALTVQVATGYANPTYRWKKDGVPLTDGPDESGFTVSGSQSPTLIIERAGPTNSGTYACEAVTSCGSRASEPATVLVSCCPADRNADALVNDADFQLFANDYDLLLCSAPGMPISCPSDFNADGMIDDADFLLFLLAYKAAICP